MSIIEHDARVTINPALNIDRLRPAASRAEIAVASARGSSGFLSRAHILEATEACFAQTGYDGTTIRAIAARLGCAVGSIYRYFTDKRELLLAVGAATMQPIVDGLLAGDSVEDSQRRYVQIAQQHGELYRLMFWLAWSPESAGLPEPIGAVIEVWEERLGEGPAARQAWAELHGMLMLGQAPPPSRLRASAEPVAIVRLEPLPEIVEAFAAPSEPEDMTLL